MLTVHSIGKRYAGEQTVEAVKNVSLDLQEGRSLAIVGRSGSGKSTLLGMIGGISRPTSGQVLIDGVDQWKLNDSGRADLRNQKLGFVFQFASLLPSLRAVDNVALPCLISGSIPAREAYARAHALLDRVGLSHRYDSFPGQLSGGEQRRVAIARALVNSPRLLLADEPTADLDEATESEILNLLIDIHRALNVTLVMVTHNPDIAARADHFIEMRAGETVSRRDTSPTASKPAEIETVTSLYEVSPEKAAAEKVRLGEGLEVFVGRMVMWIVPICVIAWCLNWAVADYERSEIQAKAQRRMALEELAMQGLRADVKSVEFGKGKTYVVTLYLRNTKGDEPLYVMSPMVRGFVQVGTSWLEVPMKSLESGSAQVLKVTGTQILKFEMEPDVPDFTQLLPYYMHVRLTNDMLISPRSQPKDDLVERNDSYYVYLKPHDADDNAILGKMKFPGKPPVWIPMPPH
ncbi:MAG: ABC transporter ATP-binding protein [Candidatus Melainabacteria bacterium]|nr:MAG: ABC transporter ATP-binding protein [Candidatus Melainabacteria bacterium]